MPATEVGGMEQPGVTALPVLGAATPLRVESALSQEMRTGWHRQ